MSSSPPADTLYPTGRRDAVLGFATCIFLSVFLTWIVSPGWDFKTNFLPAGRAVLEGRSPYSVSGFYSPIWLTPPLALLSVLPERVAWGVFSSLSVFAYLAALRRLGATLTEVWLFFFSPFVFYSLWYGNIDAYVLLGATLSPAWGVWLVMLKPQMALGILLYWAYTGARRDLRSLPRIFGPVVIVLLVSKFVGLWPSVALQDVPWNLTPWPWGLIVALPLLYLAVRRHNGKLALAAGPYFSPYVAVQSWMATMLAGLGRKWFFVGSLVGWGLVYLRWRVPVSAVQLEPGLLLAWGAAIVAATVRGLRRE
ncbi:MAG TPA: hypothetical protein VJ123_10060 [Anaerolineales bacterium]|nr:hypothetical protein [Anaerolineales bacterium]